MKVFSLKFNVADEYAVRIPMADLQRMVAQEMGGLLTAALLDPTADPFNDLKLIAETDMEFRTNSRVIKAKLYCASMPVEQPAIRPTVVNSMLTEEAPHRRVELES